MSATTKTSSVRSSRRWTARTSAARLLCVALAFAAGSGIAEGYVRIVLNNKKLHWDSSAVGWKLNTAGSDNIEDGSHLAALQHAFDSWKDVPGSKVRFTYQGQTGSKNIGGSDHLVLFDENNSTGYFPQGSGTVAVTPIQYDPGTGRILDADIVFNGRDWTWATDHSAGAFDVQAVATHEIGHFIGLDHSPVLSASMWPYVSTRQWQQRSLSADDAAGAVAVDPLGDDGRLNGSLRKSDGTVLKGALVVAVRADDGRVAASAASTTLGDWFIRGLEPGDYLVYAAPIEGAMTGSNLAGNSPVQTGFGAEFYGGHATPALFPVVAGDVTSAGTLTLPPDSPMLDSTSSITQYRRGETRTLSLWGSGFTADMGVWSESPYLSVNSSQFGTSLVHAQVTVAPDAPYGEYDLYLVNNRGEFEAATGVLEVVPPAPALAGVQPAVGGIDGGTEVTISGSGFQEGAFVLFGGREAESVVFVDEGTLVATTRSSSAGTVDVSVHNPDGQQARSGDSFTFASVPNFVRLFPEAGQTAGGTTLLIGGSAFAPEIEVLLDGEPVAATWLSANLVQVSTPAHSAGPVDLSLRNPAVPEVLVPEAFTFVPEADPQVTGFTPTKGKDGGGIKVKLFGAHLAGANAVRFGVDPVTAEGGRDAAGLVTLEPGTIQVTAPAWKAGSYGVKVVMPNGQGVVAPATFQYVPQAAGGAGGCGGMVRPADGRSVPFDLSALLIAGAGFSLLRRRRAA